MIFSPLAPGIPISEDTEIKTPSKVCTIWNKDQTLFSVHDGFLLAFTNVDNAKRYLEIGLVDSPEMGLVIEYTWETLPNAIQNPDYTKVLLDYDPKNNKVGPYEVYFIGETIS